MGKEKKVDVPKTELVVFTLLPLFQGVTHVMKKLLGEHSPLGHSPLGLGGVAGG